MAPGPLTVYLASWGILVNTIVHCGYIRMYKPKTHDDCVIPKLRNNLSQIETRAVRLGAGLSHLGVEPGDKTNVGIYSQNSVDVSLH